MHNLDIIAYSLSPTTFNDSFRVELSNESFGNGNASS